MITLTKKDVVKLLKQVVKEKGADYVYPLGDCKYMWDGAPSCLVGHVLVKAGVNMAEFPEGEIIGEINTEAYAEVHLTVKALNVLAAAQAVQDEHAPWGDALDAALEEAK